MEFKEIAIIGATASGKSRYAIEIAKKENANILSMDSLAIYRDIDIVSAKPSKEELKRVKHFGVDVVFPDQKFSATSFVKVYKSAKEESIREGKNLVLAGGTSFYLKSLLDGLSPLPEISESVKLETEKRLEDIERSYKILKQLDPKWAEKVPPNDIYRVEKALHIYLQTGKTPTQFFRENPKIAILNSEIEILNIFVEPEILRKRIAKRTENMWKIGLLDEVRNLWNRYREKLVPKNSIGIEETLQYLKGEISSQFDLLQLISTHTAQLAKRQRTFNRTQFRNYNMREVKIDTI
jgi:tRNA dimethylallyltransferase